MDAINPRLFEMLLSMSCAALGFFLVRLHKTFEKVVDGLNDVKETVHELHLTLVGEFVNVTRLKHELDVLEQKIDAKISLCNMANTGRHKHVA